MNNITNIELKPLAKDSKYLKPFSMHFIHNGVKRTWDLIEVHDSVAIIIYNTSRNVLVLVKQFRPAVYYNNILREDRHGEIDPQKYPPELGLALELCAGICDKNIEIAEIAREEILEECGYDVPVKNLEKVSYYKAGVGSNGSNQTLFYCEVTDSMKTASGGGVEDEFIEIVEMTIPDIKKYVSQSVVNSPPSFMYGILWFLNNKAPKSI